MWLRVFCLFFLTITQFSWAQDKSDVDISDSYFSATYPMATSAAGYFSLTNNGTQRISLTTILVDEKVADKAGFHQTVMDEGMISMRPMKQLDINAGETIQFQPGGNHIMLTGLKRQLAVGDSITVTFKFAEMNDVMQAFEVKARDNGKSGHHNHSD